MVASQVASHGFVYGDSVLLACAASKQPRKATWYVNRCPGHKRGSNCGKKQPCECGCVQDEVWSAIIKCTLIFCEFVISQPISVL